MRMFVLSVALLSSSVALANDNMSTTGATTAAAATTSETVPSTGEKPKAEKICKRIDASESRLAAKKVCLTADEWKKRQSDG